MYIIYTNIFKIFIHFDIQFIHSIENSNYSFIYWINAFKIFSKNSNYSFIHWILKINAFKIPNPTIFLIEREMQSRNVFNLDFYLTFQFISIHNFLGYTFFLTSINLLETFFKCKKLFSSIQLKFPSNILIQNLLCSLKANI